jgi:hypothetical protein
MGSGVDGCHAALFFLLGECQVLTGLITPQSASTRDYIPPASQHAPMPAQMDDLREEYRIHVLDLLLFRNRGGMLENPNVKGAKTKQIPE